LYRKGVWTRLRSAPFAFWGSCIGALPCWLV